MRRAGFAALFAAALLLAGCAKQEAPAAELQTGYFDTADLTARESCTENAAANYEMADEAAAPPVETFLQYEDADGGIFLFDKAGRLRRYSSHISDDSAPVESLKEESELRSICDAVLSGYLSDYDAYTEITSQYYEGNSRTYNLAMEHKIADGIADYALIRLDEAGAVYDLSITYADADGDSTSPNFMTDADISYFDEQVQPYLTALDDYPGAVTYVHYKKINGKLYAFYELTYTDTGTGLTAGQKLLAFTK